jgi:hypothetical protein
MSKRHPSGFISAFYDPLKNPDAPTIGTATGGDVSASVTFTAPSNVGGSAISEYYAISDPSRITASAASSPISVTGLTNGTAYTFQVWALNTYGPSAFSASSGSVTPALQRGIFGGGLAAGNYSNVIQYVNIASTGNATDFGDLNYDGTGGTSACSSATRGVFGGGYVNGRTNTMDYITIATTGNAINFGSLALPSGDSSTLGVGSASNSTRGLWAGGQPSAGVTNVIQYITIATTGSTTSFGSLTTSRCFISACASSTRAVFAGGGNFSSSPQTTMDYVTTASTGNATSFGSLSTASALMAVGVCSSSTRGLFAAVGATYSDSASNVIEYITIATTGNSTDFGDLTVGNKGNKKASTSSATRGLFAGGGDAPAINVIDYVTITSTGNATDFGDLLATTNGLAGLSNCHGGLS